MDFTTRALTATAAVVECSGRLNMTAAKNLKGYLDATVAGGHHKVVVDLSDVSTIDSSGLGALIGALKTARQAGGDLRIASAGVQVRSVLRLTNLERVLHPHDSVESAAHGW